MVMFIQQQETIVAEKSALTDFPTTQFRLVMSTLNGDDDSSKWLRRALKKTVVVKADV